MFFFFLIYRFFSSILLFFGLLFFFFVFVFILFFVTVCLFFPPGFFRENCSELSTHTLIMEAMPRPRSARGGRTLRSETRATRDPVCALPKMAKQPLVFLIGPEGQDLGHVAALSGKRRAINRRMDPARLICIIIALTLSFTLHEGEDLAKFLEVGSVRKSRRSDWCIELLA